MQVTGLTRPCHSRFFYQFLLGNERATAKEVRDEYVETLSKMYLSYYRSYLGRLMKVQVRPGERRPLPWLRAESPFLLHSGKGWVPGLLSLFFSMRKSLRRMI